MMNVLEMTYRDDVVALTCLIAILYGLGANKADSGVACPDDGLVFGPGIGVAPVWVIVDIILFFMNEPSSIERRFLVQRGAPQPEPPPYTADLVQNVQRAIREHMTTEELRFLLYPSGLTENDARRIRSDEAGVVWL
jgi:hypothetical protein